MTVQQSSNRSAAVAGPDSGAASAAPGSGDRSGGASALTRVLRSSLLRLAGRRLLTAIPVVWGVTFLTFAVLNLLPGDAAQALLGADATPQEVARLRVELHLNEPFLTRYGHWLGSAVTGHLGSSLGSGQLVTTILAQRLPVTFELILYAFVISLVIAIPVATRGRPQAGRRVRRHHHVHHHDRAVDRALHPGAAADPAVLGRPGAVPGPRLDADRAAAWARTCAR